MKTFQPLDSKCRSEQAAERIMEMIENGELSVGDKLPPEQEFAKQLGISRGILREGLAQLKVQGIITRKPKDGTYIQPFPKREQDGVSVVRAIREASFRNLMEMRDAIEQKACALLVDRASDEELNELREAILSGQAPSSDEELDFYFHYRLMELTGNSIFMSIVETYFQEIREVRAKSMVRPSREAEVMEEHLGIIDGIQSRDRTAAMTAVERHMKAICDRWYEQENAGGETV